MFGKNKKDMKKKNTEAGKDAMDDVECCSTRKSGCGYCCGGKKKINNTRK